MEVLSEWPSSATSGRLRSTAFGALRCGLLTSVPMHILLRVGEGSTGKPVFEPVHAASSGGSRYRIEFTPGLAYGIAAGDEIELGPGGVYTVTERAGNVAVRVFSASVFSGVQHDLIAEVEDLGGRLDGSIDKGLAFTIPLRAGFAAIENVFTRFASHTRCEWEYGNVYAEDGTALGWWEGST